jgi:hypothetical protein
VKYPPEVSPICIVDTREPHVDAGDIEESCFTPRIFGPHRRGDPWEGRPRLPLDCVRKKLDAGDYSVDRLEAHVAIERKSLQDLLATLFGDRADSLGERRTNLDRFRAELDRARGYWYFAIVVEAGPEALFREAKRRQLMYGKSYDPFAVQAILRSFLVDLGIPTVFAGTKGTAELEVGHTLARIWSQATRGEAYRSAVKRGYHPPWLGALSDLECSVEDNVRAEAELPALREMAARMGWG